MYYKVNFQPDIVIMHSPCMDGFTAGFAVWLKFREASEKGEIQFVPGVHAENKDDKEYWKNLVKDKKVVVLDFSFERELMLEMHESAEELIVLDHHKSAEEKLGDLDFCHFRQDISGALIAWHAFNDKEPPKLFQYVSDRDLWKWELEHSREINAYIRAQDKTFEEWFNLMCYLEYTDLRSVAKYGLCMVKSVNSLVDSMGLKAEVWKVNGVEVVAVNSCELQSEICHFLLNNKSTNGISGCYSIKDGKMTWSLRSAGEIDVSKIAEPFEGGGHFKAAGFSVALAGNNKVMFGVRSVTSG